MKLSPAARAAIIAAALILFIAGGVAADFVISMYMANRTVANSEQQLCQIVRLVTKTPVPKPPDPKANPSRESSYEFYKAFVTLGREYHC